MFVSVIALKYALLVSQWSHGHFLNWFYFCLNNTINLCHLSQRIISCYTHKMAIVLVTTDYVTSLHRCTLYIPLQRVTSLRRGALTDVPAASYWLRRVLDDGGCRDWTSPSCKRCNAVECTFPFKSVFHSVLWMFGDKKRWIFYIQ